MKEHVIQSVSLVYQDTNRLLFMYELRKLFALLIGSKRKYVDPTKAVEVWYYGTLFYYGTLLLLSFFFVYLTKLVNRLVLISLSMVWLKQF